MEQNTICYNHLYSQLPPILSSTTYTLNTALAIQGSALAALSVLQQNTCYSPAPLRAAQAGNLARPAASDFGSLEDLHHAASVFKKIGSSSHLTNEKSVFLGIVRCVSYGRVHFVRRFVFVLICFLLLLGFFGGGCCSFVVVGFFVVVFACYHIETEVETVLAITASPSADPKVPHA